MATVKNDEKFSFEVRKFPCLYDKSLSTYKENQPQKNAWKEIDQALGKPEGDAQKEWFLLMNRYSERRSKLRKVKASGAQTSVISKEQKSVDDYAFLRWIDNFIRSKTTKSIVFQYQVDKDDEEYV